MGLFFGSKKSPKEICDEQVDKLMQSKRPVNDSYFENLKGSTVKEFDKNYCQLGPGEVTSPILLMDALMADCIQLTGRKVSLTYRCDPESVSARYSVFSGYLKGMKDHTEEDRKAARIVCDLYVDYKRSTSAIVFLGQVFKMNLPDLLPVDLVDEIGEEYLQNDDRSGAFLLYSTYVLLDTELKGKVNYVAAKILYGINAEKYANHIKDRLKMAAAAGYPDTDGLMAKVLGQAPAEEVVRSTDTNAGDGTAENAPAQETAENAGDVAELEAKIREADEKYAKTGDPGLYYALCGEGFDKYKSGKPQEMIFDCARKYCKAIDKMSAEGQINADNVELLYRQRNMNYLLGAKGVPEFYSLAADAVRDGYGNIPIDPKMARYFYAKAAKEGDRYGQLYYGIYCMTGAGGKEDLVSAVDAFQKVIQGGDDVLAARAYYNLYGMFLTGRGVPKNIETAAGCMTLAKEWGWGEDQQKIHELRGKLGGYFKQLGNDPRVKEEIVPRLINPQTKSLELPPRF